MLIFMEMGTSVKGFPGEEIKHSTRISFCLLVSLQFDGGSLAAPDVPHDDGVV